MRTTVVLPPSVHRRALDMAQRQHRSPSAVVADLTLKGLAQVDDPVIFSVDQHSGLPVLSLGRTLGSHEVADLLDEE